MTKKAIVKELQEGMDSKRLTIEILDGIPTFEFKGEWSGKDISLIHSHLYREYRRSQRNVRRIQPVVKPQEGSDDTR